MTRVVVIGALCGLAYLLMLLNALARRLRTPGPRPTPLNGANAAS